MRCRPAAHPGRRQLAYRDLGGGVMAPSGLLSGVMEPSLAADPTGELRLAFTLGTDTGGPWARSTIQSPAPSFWQNFTLLVRVHTSPKKIRGNYP
jgi:hypothetical protein